MFKDILLDLMNEHNLNQSQLAKRAHIPPTTISGWLNAGRLPDYNALIKLSKFFSVSGDFLLGLKDY
ncbi:MAG: helix-turn-helix transcriptional regulator [Clostridia bacterium]|nr:helix-turn-helix transcriptional regulator [Clostridia bacterium]